jgi:hypothetical protein
MIPLLLFLFHFSSSAQLPNISLSDYISYFYDAALESGDSITFTLAQRRPFSLLFHQTDKFDIVFLSRSAPSQSRRPDSDSGQPSTFLSFDSTFLIESFTVTALTSQRFSFSFFAVDPRGQLFITNRINHTFTFWDSFPTLKCSPLSDVWIFLNITSPYRIFSRKPGDAIFPNSSIKTPTNWIDFERPCVVHLTDLSCTDNFTFSVHSDHPDTDPVFEFAIPQSDIEFDVDGISFDVEQGSQDVHLQIFIGIAVVVGAFAALAGVVVFRGCCRNGKLSCVGKKSPPMPDEPSPLPRFGTFAPSLVAGQAEEGKGKEGEEEVVLRADPYHLEPDEPGREASVVRKEPDSPYDTLEVC